MTGKEAKRLSSLDAMRGFAIIAMIPIHVFFISSFFNPSSATIWTVLPFPIEFRPPLGTGLILFFFVTGLSLAVSFSRRSECSISSNMRRVTMRYGIYFLSALFLDLLLFSFLASYSNKPVDLLRWLYVVPGAFSSFGAPVMCLSLAAIIASPMIMFFSCKKLLATGLGIAGIITFILYYIQLNFPYVGPPVNYLEGLPSISLLNPLLIGMYSALKGIPVMLVGASIGRLVNEGKEVKRKIMPIAITIIAAYMVIPLFLGSGLIHLLLPVWSYPNAVLFIAASSILIFSIFQIVEAKKINLGPIQALGRISMASYVGQFLILLPIISILGYPVGNIGLLFLLSTISEMIMMVLSYFYGRWRWGSPSTW